MQALNTTMTTRAKARLSKRNSDIARIAAFAKKFLRVDDAAVIFVARSHFDRTSVEQRLCDLVVIGNSLIAVPDLAIDPRFRSVQTMGETVAAFLGVPVHDSDGAAIGALCVTTRQSRIWSRSDREMLEFLAQDFDVILRLREELKAETKRTEQQRLVAREYHHRVRNAFSVSTAVVVLTGSQCTSVQSLIETTSAQLAALADAHTSIGFESEAAEMSKLIDGALKPYTFSRARVGARGPCVDISEDKVVSLGLILNELATNSTKHGALRDGGTLDVRWSVVDGQIVLRWIERTGRPKPSTRTRSGSFGGTMIELSVSQLGATIDRHWLDDGLEVSLKFPV